MAHPKRKISRTRRDKRRTHLKLSTPQLTTCPTTGETHVKHNAYWSEGKMYYRGQVVIDNSPAEEIAE
ncbi:50S ribosomal protein L32 [Algivirga pacifica]|uniref:Large ribosomal subunit protein bL32 n=1 Tax=Algivirga pacifica TaxID=1162670 RepID=A0ABP9DP86_9BACT